MSQSNVEDSQDVLDPQRLNRALAQHQVEFAALGDKGLTHINLDIVFVAMFVLKRWPSWEPLLVQIRELPGVDIESIENLSSYAEATVEANNEYAATVNPPGNLSQKLNEAEQLREKLKRSAELLEFSGDLPAGSTDNVHGLPGYRNVAADVGTLAAVYERHWDSISDKCPVTREDLDQAIVLVQEILHNAAERDARHPSVVAAALLRQQAFTKLTRAYDELRACVQFIMRDTGSADQLVPSLYAGRGGRKSPAEEVTGASGSTSVIDEPLFPEPTDSTVNVPSPAADPNALPSGSPFTS